MTGTRLERTHLRLEAWAAGAGFLGRQRDWPGVVALRTAMGVSYQTAWRVSRILRPLHSAAGPGPGAGLRILRSLLRATP